MPQKLPHRQSGRPAVGNDTGDLGACTLLRVSNFCILLCVSFESYSSASNCKESARYYVEDT